MGFIISATHLGNIGRVFYLTSGGLTLNRGAASVFVTRGAADAAAANINERDAYSATVEAVSGRAPVEIDTCDFERSHGRAPRGRGGWAFCTVNPRQADYLNHVLWKNGTYAEARRAAVAEAKLRGIEVLYDCS